MNVGSLFSGIGGLDLGLERAGMTVRWQAEVDPYCCRVLAKHWPTTPNLGDVTTIDWSTVEPVDLICGGYPCQPFSFAGARKGADDPRHLWPRMLDAIRVLRPRYAVMENVAGHLALGFGRVLGDLADLGFDAEWELLPASAVGAPHLRHRVIVVAYAAGVDGARTVGSGDSRGRPEGPVGDGGCGSLLADADGVASAATGARGVFSDPAARRSLNGAHRRGRSSGGQWAVEPDVGRVAHGVPSRVDRLRGLGNAVVPQVAEFIGRRIMALGVSCQT